MLIRSQTPDDRAAVRSVNEAAFGRPDEAGLVERLWTEGAVLVSLVAERENQILGHILFSRMSIETAQASIPAVALAPMAVLPSHQRQGIGKRLVQSGLEQLRAQGEKFAIVLGHPEYYPRFGFSTAKAHTLASPFPANAFMALELIRGALDGVQGHVRYAASFGL